MSNNDLLLGNVSDLTKYSGTPASALPSNEMGKDDFLHMLITQLKHQDPMDPMKDQDFIAQLAQFSSLEQMQNMNDNLKDNLTWNHLLSQTINNTMATSLLGKEIQAVGNEAYLPEDGSAECHFRLGAFAETVTVSVYDGSGTLVGKYDLSKLGEGDQVFEWDGRTLNGERAQPGTYTFDISAVDSLGKDISVTPYKLGIVDGVQYVEGQAYLVIDGTQISLGDVIAVGTGEEDG